MRTPARRRRLPRSLAEGVGKDALERCASQAAYVGSPEHKSYPSFAGPPRLRSDASRCPKHLNDQDLITSWLSEAIRAGNVSEDPSHVGFPRYVWGRHENTWFEARLVNPEQGTYKGYPLSDDEAPQVRS